MMILILLEAHDKKLKGYSLELASKAAQLATELGVGVEAAIIHDKPEDLAELGKYGVQKISLLQNEAFAQYNSDGYATVLAGFISSAKPKIVLATASSLGKDILPRVAMRLKTGLAQDCTDFNLKDGKLIAKRPVYAGKALTTVAFHTDLMMATARPNVFLPTPAAQATTPSISGVKCDAGALRAKVKEAKVEEAGEVDLTEAGIIVSGGRAMGSGDNFKIIRNLAKVLGATVGASRAAVDAGYISHDHQVGQTGKTVNPTLYIACGISGAIQHLAGMRTSKVIVAINKDAEAPIFKKADFGVVGDLFKILPLLTEKLKPLMHK